MAQLGDELCACPDWTPLEPRFRSRGSLKELVALPKALTPRRLVGSRTRQMH